MTALLWIIVIGLVTWASCEAIAASTAQRDFPTVRFYDERGRPTGSATNYGSQIRVYGPDGKGLGTITDNRKK